MVTANSVTISETAVPDQVLNPALYRALVSVFGEVRIVNCGQRAQVAHHPDPRRPGKFIARYIVFGENYAIKCPICRDHRARCYVNHRLGVFDPLTESDNYHHFHCFHENCHKMPKAGQRFRRVLSAVGYSRQSVRMLNYSNVPSVVSPSTSPMATPCALPSGFVPLLQLPREHLAHQYLYDRRFDPVELSVRYGVGYCDTNSEIKPFFENRLVIPVYAPSDARADRSSGEGKLVGWQARAINSTDYGPKYLSLDGMKKSEVLYGLNEAVVAPGPVVLCEGVTDVWRVGPGSLGLYGKTISAKQQSLLREHFRDRPVVVLLDPDARADALEMIKKLRCDHGRVVLVDVPEGYDDPGDCDRELLWEAIHKKTGQPAEKSPAAFSYRILDGERNKLTETGLRRLGSTVAITCANPAPSDPLSLSEDSSSVMAMVGENLVRRYVPCGVARVLRSLRTRRRVYFDSLTARRFEAQHGLPAPEEFDDVQMAARLLQHPGASDLEALAESLLATNDTIIQPASAVPSARHGEHLLRNAELAERLWTSGRLQRQLCEQGLEFVYGEIEKPLVAPVVAMMQHGLPVDVDLLHRSQLHYEQEKQRIHSEIGALLGHPVDLGTDQAIRELLFGTLRLPVATRTHSGEPSVNELALKALRGSHPIVEHVIRVRKIAAVTSALLRLSKALPATRNRIHCEFDPLGAETGRFSCHSPNLQNLPPEARAVIVAESGHTLLEADLSQIEYRVLAQLSQDPVLVATYAKGKGDLHRRTASLLLSRPENLISHADRQLGKQVNFAILYGMTATSLADTLGISVEDAEDFVDGFWAEYPRARRWADDVIATARDLGYAQTLYGRRRALAGFRSDSLGEVRHSERQALNTAIQGTAADIFKLMLIRLHRSLPSSCRLVMCVHDSVLLEVPQGLVDAVVPIVRSAMETPPPNFDVPLAVDIHVGPDWASCKSDETLVPAKGSRAKRRKARRVVAK